MPSSTPRLSFPYPLPTDQVAEGAADIQALALSVENTLAGDPMLTTFPANPKEGQPATINVGSGFFWSFIRAGGVWRFAGGPALVVSEPGRIAFGAGWASLGPELVLPFRGVYQGTMDFAVDGASGGGAIYCCPGVDAVGWPPDTARAAVVQAGSPYGGWTPFIGSTSGIILPTLELPAGVALRLHYMQTGTGGVVLNKRLAVTPVYVVT